MGDLSCSNVTTIDSNAFNLSDVQFNDGMEFSANPFGNNNSSHDFHFPSQGEKERFESIDLMPALNALIGMSFLLFLLLGIPAAESEFSRSQIAPILLFFLITVLVSLGSLYQMEGKKDVPSSSGATYPFFNFVESLHFLFTFLVGMGYILSPQILLSRIYSDVICHVSHVIGREIGAIYLCFAFLSAGNQINLISHFSFSWSESIPMANVSCILHDLGISLDGTLSWNQPSFQTPTLSSFGSSRIPRIGFHLVDLLRFRIRHTSLSLQTFPSRRKESQL